MAKKILIIENEKMLNELYSLKLTTAGFKTISASNLREGLYFTRTEKPDLILLETFLQGESSLDFLTELQNNPKLANTKIMAFSNYDDPETKKGVEKLGVKDYLIKSNYTPKELVEKIKAFLE